MKITIRIISAFILMTVVFLAMIHDAAAQVKIENAFPDLNFTRPLDLQCAGDGSGRLFVVEQQGRIYVFQNDQETTDKMLFLDIRDRVNDDGNEQGLLGLAFHPDYESNGYFFVDYTASDPNRTVIARYEVSVANADSALKSSETVILEVAQPYSNHNAGQILFGADGYLYITLGDGGSGGDPQGNGQDLSTLLGSILRIDVNQTQGDKNYAIPPDNPFVANQREFRQEIWAYGLRNPWRMSFDHETGWLWAADVGQNEYEEIDIIEKGKNYGWNIMEGFHCYNADNCDTTDLTMPVWEYDHSLGSSVTGGFVYRGPGVPEFTGKYIYADYISGRIWMLAYDGEGEPVNQLFEDTGLLIASFGTDAENELYICAFDGRIYKFVSESTGILNKQRMQTGAFRLGVNYPNPFNPETTIRYELFKTDHVKLTVYNGLGQKVDTLVDGIQTAGEKSVQWHAKHALSRGMGSGIYYYTLNVNGFSKTRKMLLLK